MSYFNSIPSDLLPGDDNEGRARQAALAEREIGEDFATAMVDFNSRGRLLVIGAADRITPELDALDARGRCCLLVVEGQLSSDVHAVYHAQAKDYDGHLGAFTVVIERDEQTFNLGELVDVDAPEFDLVIDLSTPSLNTAEVKPLGYFAPKDSADFAAVMNQLESFTGEFHKPRFFRYDPDICAHGRSGLAGCTRCIDHCPTGAIISVGETVEVNPYYCQGGGVCTSTCPTGAMRYAWPPAATVGTRVKATIEAYQKAGGDGPMLLFHDGESGYEYLSATAETLPSNLVPFAVEEAAAIGPEIWLSALAWGAGAVALLTTDAVAESVREGLAAEVAVANHIVRATGWSENPVLVIHTHDRHDIGQVAWPPVRPIEHATFELGDEKRNAIRVAADHLARTASSLPTSVTLPATASFGYVSVDESACTLCMGCVAVCPTNALLAGGDNPALRHIEWNCVQCGACESACPEDALTRHPRFLFDNDKRMTTQTLKEEAPFHCVSCGKAFATASMMSRMQEKLADHWMFQTAEQKDRLKMCEDCRIADMFDKDGALAAHEPPKNS